MNFILKIIFLMMILPCSSYADINMTLSHDKIKDNIVQKQKFPFNKIEKKSPFYSRPYMSKARSAIFRTILNPVYSSTEKKIVDMSSIKQ